VPIPWTAIFFGLFGGIGVLLYGIQVMGDGLQKILGKQLRSLLESVTRKPLLGVLAGVVLTILFQSSTATTVILVGLSNAAVITLRQSMPVILGADIGTSVTAQLIALKVTEISLLIVGLGSPMVFFAKQERHRRIGQAIMGFGLLFLGLKIIADNLQPLQKVPEFSRVLLLASQYPLAAVLVSSVITFLIHSSAAVLGIIMVLASYHLIDLRGAVYLLLGCNVGTSFTALLSSIGSRREAQRVALAHFFSKLGGTALFFPWVSWYASFLASLTANQAFQVSNAHTFFNIGLAALFLPFSRWGSRFLEWLLPDKKIPELEPKYLREEVVKLPAVAIGLAHRETVRLSAGTLRMLWYTERTLTQGKGRFLDRIAHQEKVMDILFKAVVDYLTRVLRQPLSGDEHRYAIGLIHILDNLEKISDIIERDIKYRIETKLAVRVNFSPQGETELVNTVHRVIDQLRLTHKGLVENDFYLAEEAVTDQPRIAAMIREYRQNHIHRLTEGIKESEETSNLHLELLNSYQQISETTRDIAFAIMEELDRCKGCLVPARKTGDPVSASSPGPSVEGSSTMPAS
jgi:phosphate:Na+ symporter